MTTDLVPSDRKPAAEIDGRMALAASAEVRAEFLGSGLSAAPRPGMTAVRCMQVARPC
jgi:hypothetical protein